MAIELWGVGPNGSLENVVVSSTATTCTSGIVNVLVDFTSTNVTDNSTPTGTRAIYKEEVLRALKVIEEQIVRGNWPPP